MRGGLPGPAWSFPAERAQNPDALPMYRVPRMTLELLEGSEYPIQAGFLNRYSMLPCISVSLQSVDVNASFPHSGKQFVRFLVRLTCNTFSATVSYRTPTSYLVYVHLCTHPRG